MNRKERRAAQKRGGPAMTPMAATLAQAFRAHQTGYRSEAERLYRDVLAVEPRNAAALHLLGALMHQSGRTDEAVSLMRQAIAIEPRNPDYHYNLGSALVAAGRMTDAIEPLSKAIALKPQYAEAHFEIGNAYARSGQLDSAEKSLRRALDLQPANAAIMNNLGRVLRAMDRAEDAAAIWQRAVTLQPGLAIAHLNIGMVRHEQSRLDDAEQSLRRALEIQPDFPEATQQLAAVMISRGRAHDALPLVAQALARSESPDLKATFAQSRLAAQEFRPDHQTRTLFQRAIAEAWIRPAMLAPLGALILKAHPTIGQSIRRVAGQWGNVPASQLLPIDAEIEAAAQEPLFSVVLNAAANIDVEIERFLTVLRASLLQRAQSSAPASDKAIDLYASLARQCFMNEYVFAETEDERTRVHALQTAICNAIRNNDAIAPLQLAALAAYRPLYRLDGAEALSKRNWPESIRALLTQQIDAPLEEAGLRASIPALTQVADHGSEEPQDGPSPRWGKAATTLRPLPLDYVLRTSLPNLGPLSIDGTAPDVLIAGCGSGERAVEAALSYQNSRVLAVDESVDDLAYGRRQAQACGLQGITFARAELSSLASIGRSFDVIEWSSLLRSADPRATWDTLASLLRPGGVMRVGLLSEPLHAMIAAVQDFAKQGNYLPNIEGVRQLRQNLLRLPADNGAAKAALSSDFFATGTCRALAFGLHHQRLTLPEIAAMLEGNYLELLGVEVPSDIRQAFAKRFPDPAARTDLAAWHAFERAQANAFGLSFQLWLRKRRA